MSDHKALTPPADAGGSLPAGVPITSCPLQPPVKRYIVVVKVSTRAGNIPLHGISVSVDGASIGNTDGKGKSGESPMRSQDTAMVEVIYENAGQRLKREVFTLSITGIRAESKSFIPGEAKNFIAKIQDVFGSGEGGFSGDKGFTDVYSGSGYVKMEDTDDPDIKLMTVTVKMSTISLQVPYFSQVGIGEMIQAAPPTPANPEGVKYTFQGNIICMPTATKMSIAYWGITATGGSELTRNILMQECWDEHANPTAAYPCPWQEWTHLRNVVGDLVEAAHPGVYTVDSGPAGDGGSIPSAYADGIVSEIEKGKPVVTSTYATGGHVMCVRGAVVKHNGEAEWLILNDPYGSLATEDSVYGDLDISAPVGLRGVKTGPMNQLGDVKAVREVLEKLGHYTGSLDGPLDETDDDDLTVVSIRAFQGGQNPDGRVDDNGHTERLLNRAIDRGTRSSYSTPENERNVAAGNNDIGLHVYYNGQTEAKGPGNSGQFRLKTQAWTLVIEKVIPLTKDEIRQNLVPAI